MFANEPPPAPSAVVEKATHIVSEGVRHWLPEAWVQAHRGRPTYEGAFGSRATTPYERIANLRELIIEYLEDVNRAADRHSDPR